MLLRVCTIRTALVYLILFPLKRMLNDLWSERVLGTRRAELSIVAEVLSNLHPPRKRVARVPRDPFRLASKGNRGERTATRKTLVIEINQKLLVERKGQKQ
jgi:hypothetical protein